jgi:UDP-glucose 4-epimerase
MPLCLVTGGAGFIGSHLVEALIARGYGVRVLDNFSSGLLDNLAPMRQQIELVTANVRDFDSVRQAMHNVEFVFHLAGSPSIPQSLVDPMGAHQGTATGTLQVLQAARATQVKRVILGSSAVVYGQLRAPPLAESHPTQAISPHAVAQICAEEYAAIFGQVFRIEIVRLRFFNVFGPRQSARPPFAAVIPQFLEAMTGGRSPLIHGDGLQTRDFTYVSDVVQASLLAMEAPRVAGKVFNVGTGRPTALIELVDRINQLLGSRIRPVHDGSQAWDIRASHADISRAQTELGYCPCTDLQKDLQKCLESYVPQPAPAKEKAARPRKTRPTSPG